MNFVGHVFNVPFPRGCEHVENVLHKNATSSEHHATQLSTGCSTSACTDPGINRVRQGCGITAWHRSHESAAADLAPNPRMVAHIAGATRRHHQESLANTPHDGGVAQRASQCKLQIWRGESQMPLTFYFAFPLDCERAAPRHVARCDPSNRYLGGLEHPLRRTVFQTVHPDWKSGLQNTKSFFLAPLV